MHPIAISRLWEAAAKFPDVATQIEDWNEDVLPQPIQSQSEYERALQIVEALMHKETVSVEEERLIDLFVILIEKFEAEHYPSQN